MKRLQVWVPKGLTWERGIETEELVPVNGRPTLLRVRRSPTATSVYVGNEWIQLATHPLQALQSILVGFVSEPSPDPFAGQDPP